ncbi:MAG: glycogen debranching protein GlgX [Betaproteobacteria bacterium]|nr:glycogen debranching protein GlgX [Betaproteobacteria bacterium]
MRRLAPGSPEPLGITLVPGGANVAVFSAHASAIELCLFDAAGNAELERIPLPGRTGDVHHGFVADIVAGQRYGLRAHGPYETQAGHRFNPAKLLVDPYATAIDRAFRLDPSLYGEQADGWRRSDTDSAGAVPKGIVQPPFAPAPATRPCIPWADTVVYELHVRGFTRSHPDIPPSLRGTLAGLAHPAGIAHFVRLGVTTLELMPVAAAVDEPHLARHGLTNYWGYNPIAMMAPDPRLAPGGMGELTACVAALHQAGIEVLLDVVFNHTGEGEEWGPVLSLRGLDNASYYRARADDRAHYANDAGCGNTLALDRPPALGLALDTLRHYATVAGVDGFRFDLATTLGRRADGFDPDAPLLAAIASDPVLRDLKLVAEPWDVGPGGYQLGAFPAAWGEWNDRYRDTVRRFWRSDAGMVGELATRIAGSSDFFPTRAPSRSVNFVCAHDGFTLADLVAYEHKHNDANEEANRDGTDSNFSWNHGVEGFTDDPAIIAARSRDVRSLMATLLLSRGTPMLSMGDELGRTQHGNNNAYSQDNALTAIDWANADTGLVDFVATLIDLRRRHPALRSDHRLSGEPIDASGFPDVEWRLPEGRPPASGDWADQNLRTLVAALYAAPEKGVAGDRVAIAFHAGHESIAVRWPDPRDGFRWRRALDTSMAGGRPDPSSDDVGDLLAPRSAVLLVEEAEPSPRAHARGIEPAVLDRLARAAGIGAQWHEVSGTLHVVGDDTRRELLAAMGLEVSSTGQARERLAALVSAREGRRLPRTQVVAENETTWLPLSAVGHRPERGVLCLCADDGTTLRVPFARGDCQGRATVADDGRVVQRLLVALPALAAGHYLATLEGEPEACHLVVTPRRCFLPPELLEGRRRFGLAAHLYALRRPGDQGIGDFTTLAQVANATARAGGALVGLNPLHAMFPGDRDRASPYHPSDRRFLDALYLDVEAVPDFTDSQSARRALEQNSVPLLDLAASPTVEYPGVWAVKRRVLEACFEAFVQRPAGDALVAEYGRFVAQGGDRLRRFAAFEAIAATRPGVPWQRWPAELRRPDDPGVARFAARNARAVDFSIYLQWLADRQLAHAARSAREGGLGIGFYRDLAVGAAPDGAEAWSNQALLARGVSIGAPPDPFCLTGQVWMLPPPRPDALAAGGYEDFRALIAANVRHAGALRIDHVMGLTRQFWVPEGATATEGAYVRFPLEDLLGVLALESRLARCLIVGEDLGTVPDGFRERLDASDVLSYRVLWFERDGAKFRAPGQYPAKAIACVSTHDLPTIRGWWKDAAPEERQALGPAGGDPVATAHALHRLIGATPCALALVQADDLAGEETALNLPGTDRERPNWRRKVGVEAAELWKTPIGAQAAQDLLPGRGPAS